MSYWKHQDDLRDYFDGKFEADLGLHGTGFEREGSTEPTAQHIPPNGRAAREAILRISAVLKRISMHDFWVLAAYYTPIKPCDRNGFRELLTYKETTAQFLHDSVLPPAEEGYSRIALITARAQKEATRVLSREPETMAEVRAVVRTLRVGGQEKKSEKKVAEIIEESKSMLSKAQIAYDKSVAAIEAEATMAKRRKFLEGL